METPPLRTLTDHIVEGDLPQNQLRIEATDAPGAGGANHVYVISTQRGKGQTGSGRFYYTVRFQNGPIQEVGVNGITHEVLLAIVIDRLRSFQAGPFPSSENKMAMGFCELALEQLQKRTKGRLARGVEGKTQA